MALKPLKFDNPSLKGFVTVKKFHRDDYFDHLYPILEECRRKGSKVAIYLEFGEGFKGFALNGLFEEEKFSLRYLGRIRKLAVVSDLRIVRGFSVLVGSLIPCHVKVFNTGQSESAKAWLEFGREGVGFELNTEEGELFIHVDTAISPEDLDIMGQAVDSYIEGKGRVRGVLIQTETFSGWKNFGGFLSHLDFLKEGHKDVQRVALVSEEKLSELVRPIREHFSSAKVKYFDEKSMEEALSWLREADDEEARPHI